MNPSKLLILLTFLLFYSCSMFEHRQFIDEMEYQFDEPLFAAHYDFMVVAGDSGRDYRTNREIYERTPATAMDSESLRYKQSLNRELQFLENKLDNDQYEHYLQYKQKLGNTSQQIYYLRLSAKERRDYLRGRGLLKQSYASSYSPRSKNFYQQALPQTNSMAQMPKINDIILGMTKNDVLQNWGQPERRDVAGDPSLENERWAYRKKGSVKYIYFESGRVEGWNEQ